MHQTEEPKKLKEEVFRNLSESEKEELRRVLSRFYNTQYDVDDPVFLFLVVSWYLTIAMRKLPGRLTEEAKKNQDVELQMILEEQTILVQQVKELKDLQERSVVTIKTIAKQIKFVKRSYLFLLIFTVGSFTSLYFFLQILLSLTR